MNDQQNSQNSASIEVLSAKTDHKPLSSLLNDEKIKKLQEYRNLKNQNEGIKKTELFDTNMMHLLKNHNRVADNEKYKLEIYKKNSCEYGKNSVVYNHKQECKNLKAGRLYGGGICLQNMSRFIRAALAVKYYNDTDMENCQYRILADLCNKFKIPNTYITYYINNRDAVLKMFSNERSTSKNLFLSLLFNGDISVFREDYILNEELNILEDEKENAIIFLNELKNEIKNILSSIYDRFPDFYKLKTGVGKKKSFIENKSNKHASLLSMVLQTEENKILMALDEFFYINDRYMDVFIYDGGFIRKLDGEIEICEKLLKDAEDYIFNELGYNIKLVQKKLIHGFENDKPKINNDFDENSELYKLILCTFTMTDKNFADLIYFLYKDVFICAVIDGKKKWFFFNGNYWDINGDVNLRNFISNNVVSLYVKLKKYYSDKCEEIDGVDEESEKWRKIYIEKMKICDKAVNHLSNLKTSGPIVSKLADYFFINSRDWFGKINSNRNLLGFKNGVWDFIEKKFRNSRPDDFITMTTGYEYTENVPNEVINDVNSFLDSLHNTDDDRKSFKNFLSYTLCGNRRLEFFYIIIGNGANGKGLVHKLIGCMFGDYYKEISSDILTNDKNSNGGPNSELAQLAGVRYVCTSEPRENQSFQSDLLKKYTGGDIIQARDLFQSAFCYKPQFFLTIQTNQDPNMSAMDGGVARRAKYLIFPNKFVDNPINPNEKKADNNLKMKIENDNIYGLALFNILIKNYYDSNIETINMNDIISESVKEDSQDYLNNSDIMNWLRENNVFKLSENKSDFVKASDLLNSFISDNPINRKMKMEVFRACLNAHGIIYKRRDNVRVFYGIKNITDNIINSDDNIEVV